MRRDYGFCRTVQLRHADAVSAVVQALAQEGFHVLTEIHMETILQESRDASCAPYVVLGVCNPEITCRALQIEPELGLLLVPCTVIVIEAGDGMSTVGIVDPIQMLAPVKNPELQAIADQLNQRLFRAYMNVAVQAAFGPVL